MTAIKPIESLRVRGVPATKYPTNKVCAMPDCTKPAEGTHHCFPRSLIGNDSYFVTILDDEGNECSPFPHAVGLCGSGTTGHHGDVEEHRAWIKLEDDGTFAWFDRHDKVYESEGEMLIDRYERGGNGIVWERVGPLNPQPGSREGKPKRKRTVKGTTERAERKTVSVRLPEGFNGEDWDDLIESVDAALKRLEDSPLDPNRAEPVVGVCVVYGLQAFLGLGGWPTYNNPGELKADLRVVLDALADAQHALLHLTPRPYAALSALSEHERWQRDVIAAGLGESEHPCSHGDECPLVRGAG